jgi:hypothetical protein
MALVVVSGNHGIGPTNSTIEDRTAIPPGQGGMPIFGLKKT